MRDGFLAGQFPQLKKGEVYADWTGAALPPVSLLDEWHSKAKSQLWGNPHSHHRPSSDAMKGIIEARQAILEYFNVQDNEYEVIFTSGATAAIRLMQHFKYEGGELLLTADNHNSVNGLREDARRHGAVVRYAPITDRLILDNDALTRMLTYPRSTGNKLFIYPAKSNYTGTKHDLAWVTIAQRLGWSVMLDAAAYCSNNRLNLSWIKPDFIPLSFYKLFGFPTGIGALLVRRAAYEKLHKRWFAGGSILLVSVMKDFHAPESLGYARFEDGTVNFGMIPAIAEGLKFMTELHEGQQSPDGHAGYLANSLFDRLDGMKVGRASILIHSMKGSDTVTFSIKNGNKTVDAWLFEQYANKRGVYVRTGCFCNPGVNEKVFGYSIDQFERFYNSAIMPNAITIEKLREYTNETAIGAIRASFGYANTLDDIKKFADVTESFLKSLNKETHARGSVHQGKEARLPQDS